MTGRRAILRGRARQAVAAAAGAAAVLLGVGPAGAVPVLDSADATELAQALAEATEEQDVCYGWHVRVSAAGALSTDEGSSLGVGPTDIESQCERYVVFRAFLYYASASSEAEDSASFDVESNIPGAPTADDLRRTGISNGGLLGENDDQVVANAALALPLLMTEKGLAPALTLEANTEALPSGDRATGTPGSDWLREYGALVATAAVPLAGGLGWAAWIMLRERPFAAAPARTKRTGPSSGTRRRRGGLR